MRYTILLLTAILSFTSWNHVLAQGNDTVIAYYEERIRALTSRVEDLTQSQAELVKAINKLQRQCNILAQDVDKLNEKIKNLPPPADISNAASLDSVKQLQAALVSLENKFIASEKERKQENKKLMDQLIAISKMTPAVPSEPKKQPVKKEETPEYSKTYEWTVESGQTLSSIVQTINNSGGKTSVNAILKANKGLKAETLRVGQKIIIPDIGSK